MSGFLQGSEKKYILYSGIFLFVYFRFILPVVIKMLDGNSPFFQFLVFNLGMFLFLTIFLKSMTVTSTINLRTALGMTLLWIAMDIPAPEFHVSSVGELISGGLMGVASSDYVAGLLGQSMGISGLWLYLFVYVGLVTLLLYLCSILLDNFVKKL